MYTSLKSKSQWNWIYVIMITCLSIPFQANFCTVENIYNFSDQFKTHFIQIYYLLVLILIVFSFQMWIFALTNTFVEQYVVCFLNL